MSQISNTGSPGTLPEERPLTARSVIASTLLGLPGAWLDTATLVRSGGLFGIADGTTRVALSRMAAAGELEPADGGYRLAGHLVARQARQAASRRGTTRSWDGRWAMQVVDGEGRPADERARLRRALAARRLAELRSGVWLRPDNLPPPPPGPAEDLIADRCQAIDARPDRPAALAARLWDLDRWAAHARVLAGRCVDGERRLAADGTAALAPTFVLSATVLRHLQADPLLPGPLLPDGWPGRSLRETYESFDAAFTQVWTDWYRS